MLASRLTDIRADLQDAAQRLWFAGLGALALAQEEGNRLAEGTGRLFALLVEKGRELEKDGFTPLARVKDASGTAGETWTRFQAMVDTQVTDVLHRLGVPTKGEIGELSRRIEQLTASIEALKAQG
jgi:poly(hydroxyalkanoate) granule-associated protein